MRYDHEQELKYLIQDKTECDFEIISAIEGVSKTSGNEMITLDVKVFHDGNEFQLKHYLTGKNVSHIKQLCALSGQDFNADYLDPDRLIGVSGKCVVRVEKSQDPQYNDKNKIGKFIVECLEPSKVQTEKPSKTESKDGKSLAWEELKRLNPGLNRDDLTKLWNVAIKTYGPNKPQASFTDVDWSKVTTGINKSAVVPVDDDPPIKEDDIPF